MLVRSTELSAEVFGCGLAWVWLALVWLVLSSVWVVLGWACLHTIAYS